MSQERMTCQFKRPDCLSDRVGSLENQPSHVLIPAKIAELEELANYRMVFTSLTLDLRHDSMHVRVQK